MARTATPPAEVKALRRDSATGAILVIEPDLSMRMFPATQRVTAAHVLASHSPGSQLALATPVTEGTTVSRRDEAQTACLSSSTSGDAVLTPRCTYYVVQPPSLPISASRETFSAAAKNLQKLTPLPQSQQQQQQQQQQWRSGMTGQRRPPRLQCDATGLSPRQLTPSGSFTHSPASSVSPIGTSHRWHSSSSSPASQSYTPTSLPLSPAASPPCPLASSEGTWWNLTPKPDRHPPPCLSPCPPARSPSPSKTSPCSLKYLPLSPSPLPLRPGTVGSPRLPQFPPLQAETLPSPSSNNRRPATSHAASSPHRTDDFDRPPLPLPSPRPRGGAKTPRSLRSASHERAGQQVHGAIGPGDGGGHMRRESSFEPAMAHGRKERAGAQLSSSAVPLPSLGSNPHETLDSSGGGCRCALHMACEGTASTDTPTAQSGGFHAKASTATKDHPQQAISPRAGGGPAGMVGAALPLLSTLAARSRSLLRPSSWKEERRKARPMVESGEEEALREAAVGVTGRLRRIRGVRTWSFHLSDSTTAESVAAAEAAGAVAADAAATAAATGKVLAVEPGTGFHTSSQRGDPPVWDFTDELGQNPMPDGAHGGVQQPLAQSQLEMPVPSQKGSPRKLGRRERARSSTTLHSWELTKPLDGWNSSNPTRPRTPGAMPSSCTSVKPNPAADTCENAGGAQVQDVGPPQVQAPPMKAYAHSKDPQGGSQRVRGVTKVGELDSLVSSFTARSRSLIRLSSWKEEQCKGRLKCRREVVHEEDAGNGRSNSNRPQRIRAVKTWSADCREKKGSEYAAAAAAAAAAAEVASTAAAARGVPSGEVDTRIPSLIQVSGVVEQPRLEVPFSFCLGKAKTDCPGSSGSPQECKEECMSTTAHPWVGPNSLKASSPGVGNGAVVKAASGKEGETKSSVDNTRIRPLCEFNTGPMSAQRYMQLFGDDSSTTPSGDGPTRYC